MVALGQIEIRDARGRFLPINVAAVVAVRMVEIEHAIYGLASIRSITRLCGWRRKLGMRFWNTAKLSHVKVAPRKKWQCCNQASRASLKPFRYLRHVTFPHFSLETTILVARQDWFAGGIVPPPWQFRL